MSEATTDESKAALGTLLAEQLTDSSRTVKVTVTDTTLLTSRRLSNVEFASATSIQVTYSIDALLLSPDSLVTSDVVLGMRDSLNTYVTSGAFSTALQGTGLSVFSSATSNSITVDLAFVETEVPAQPATPSSSQHSPVLSKDQLAYVVVLASVGGLALLILAFFFGRGYLQSKTSSGPKAPRTVAIIPLQSDLTFIDIERLNTPDSAAAAAAAGVMHTSEGDADVYVQRRVNSTRKMRGDKTQSKGRSFFDFEGVQGMFTRSPPSKRSHPNDEEDSEASIDDFVDSIDEPDRESQPHIEQTNPIRALVAAQQRARRTSNGSSASNDPVSGPLSGLQPVRPHESSLFFQDDSSSVDSDTPIVLRESAKKPIATAAHSSVVRVRPQKPDSSDSDATDAIDAVFVKANASSKPSPDKAPEPQSLASSSRDSVGLDWGVARVSEKDRFGRF